MIHHCVGVLYCASQAKVVASGFFRSAKLPGSINTHPSAAMFPWSWGVVNHGNSPSRWGVPTACSWGRRPFSRPTLDTPPKWWFDMRYLGKLSRPHCDLTGIMIYKGNHPKWPEFRSVKYYNLPRYMLYEWSQVCGFNIHHGSWGVFIIIIRTGEGIMYHQYPPI